MDWEKAAKVFVSGYNYYQNRGTGTHFLDNVADFLSTLNFEKQDDEQKMSGGEDKNKKDHKDEEAPEGTDENLICTICKFNKRNVLLLPCTHTSTCIACTEEIKISDNLCPICRIAIKQAITYYRP